MKLISTIFCDFWPVFFWEEEDSQLLKSLLMMLIEDYRFIGIFVAAAPLFEELKLDSKF